MPLPSNPRAPWPPKEWAPLQKDLDEASVWYGGDPKKLADFYTSTERQMSPTDQIRLWGRRRFDLTKPKPKRLHVPVAADVAAASADLLFGEAPTLTIPEAHQANASSEAKAAEDRLGVIVEDNDIIPALLEGAEVCAGIGGIYLRPVWDQQVADFPMLDIVHADRSIPEFRFGVLTAVTFWTVLHDDNNVVVRHLERHESGVILHGLYVGDDSTLGAKVPLTADAATAELEDVVQLPAAINGLAVRYVPNVLPNRKHRRWPVGRADTSGSETLMDAIDETFTSWLRDIRVGQARIVVPSEFMDRAGRGAGATFDGDREVFTTLDIDPNHMANAGITPVEFIIRHEAHLATSLALFDRIVTTAGYSPQTFGLHIEGAAESGTALRVREGRTLRTKSRKERYFDQAVADVGEIMLIIDREVLGHSDTQVMRPRLGFADSLINDPSELAQTIDLLARANAVSIETRVRMAQPDLDEPEVIAEVRRIRDDQGLNLPDPTGGLP
jgi:A118 family predicted phage portal protein